MVVQRTLGTHAGGLKVGPQGLGCMGMSSIYTKGLGNEEENIKVLHKAIEAGCMLDTSDVYGPFTNEELISRAIAGIPRQKVIIATKFGLVLDASYNMSVDGSRKHVREACEASLKRLGVNYIDLYYLHRKDPATPIEETMAELKLLVEEGKIRHIGVSELTASDLRKAHAIHPLTALQLEWSLFTRDAEDEIIPLCRELGIGIVAYSPLGRGVLSGQIKSIDDLGEDDWRRTQPRFQAGAFEKNLELVKQVHERAVAKGLTPGQLALAWLLAQGEDVVPIPGTKRLQYLEENLAANEVRLSPQELKELTELADAAQVVGERYDPVLMQSSFNG